MKCSLKEFYRPKSLYDVVGQPAVRQLRALARRPRPCCLLLLGNGGTGKTSAAFALANDLGCSDGWGRSLYVECGCNLTAELVRAYFWEKSPFVYHGGEKGMHLLVIEELEAVNATVQGLLKDALERRVAEFGNVIVVATSNDISKFGHTATARALLQRFDILNFEAGPCFQDAYNDKLPGIWAERMGADTPMPPGWQSWGLDGDDFSARLALSMCERYIMATELDTEGIYA